MDSPRKMVSALHVTMVQNHQGIVQHAYNAHKALLVGAVHVIYAQCPWRPRLTSQSACRAIRHLHRLLESVIIAMMDGSQMRTNLLVNNVLLGRLAKAVHVSNVQMEISKMVIKAPA